MTCARTIGLVVLLAVALATPTSWAETGVKALSSPDPTEDPLMMNAGFLSSHPDLRYRMLGLEKYKDKKYEEAFRFFQRASYYADKPSQGMVAEMLWDGLGIEPDRALAYAWMDLAAERGYRGFLGLRERYWDQLSEAEQARSLEEGLAVYAKYGDDAAKPRIAGVLRRERKKSVGSRTGFTGSVQILVPGPGGSMDVIDGSKYYDDRYWDAEKYQAWHDSVWMKPRVGLVHVGEIEQTSSPIDSRVPQVEPEVNAEEPDVPELPHQPKP